MIVMDSDAAAAGLAPLALVQALRDGHGRQTCPEAEHMLLSEPAPANDVVLLFDGEPVSL